MKLKHIAVCCLLVVASLGGCSQGNNELNGLASLDEVSIVPTQTVDVAEIAASSSAVTQNVSFSAGDEAQSPMGTPRPTQIVEPSATATPVQTPGQSSSPGRTAEPAPVITPKPVVTPKPTAPPNPTKSQSTSVIPTPTEAVQPAPTPIPTSEPTPPLTPQPPTGRTICNTCGADITGHVAAHGDSHLLNNENFSYRVE